MKNVYTAMPACGIALLRLRLTKKTPACLQTVSAATVVSNAQPVLFRSVQKAPVIKIH